MKPIHALISLLFLLQKWRFIGVAWVLPTSDGFVGSSQNRPIHRPSECKVVTRVDDLQAQTQKPEDSNGEEKSPLMQDRLWSYVFNLQKARKSGDVKPARSLLNFLQTNQALVDDASLVEVLERALTQALRLLGEAGDYRLIQQMVFSAVQFANGQAVLKPRIFGEALDSLSKTHANASKIKQIWNTVAGSISPFLSSPLSAFELNVMLKSLASRGKARACSELYRQHTDALLTEASSISYIEPDAYTASTMFSILTDSIYSGQTLEAPPQMGDITEASALEQALRKLSSSSCWQWNFAIEILSTLRNDTQWNNYAYSALIKLQTRTQELIAGHENGPRIVMAILDSMLSRNMQPDVVTSTLAIKAMGDPKSDSLSWKMSVHFLEQMKTDRGLPNPNEYSYAAAIVACARCREYNTALDLLKEMRTGVRKDAMTSFVPPKLNAWVYNAVLLAIASPDEIKKHRRAETRDAMGACSRYELALRLLDQMKYDYEHLGMDTLPDTVSYNTVLAIRLPLNHTPAKNLEDHSTLLIDQMKNEGITRDAITYRNAIMACNKAASIVDLLNLASDDIGKCLPKRRAGSSSSKAVHDMTFVYNAALSSRVLRSSFRHFKQAMEIMGHRKVSPNSETLTHLIKALGRNGKADSLMGLLRTFYSYEHGGNTSEGQFATNTGIFLPSLSCLKLEPTHYAIAIESCLLANNLDEARKILSLMREHGVAPTAKCLEGFAAAYAQAAIRVSSKKSRRSMASRLVAISRAQSAYKIASALQDLSPAALSKVAKACAMTANWADARTMLRSAHSALLTSGSPLRRPDIEVVRGMHSSLIRECARQSNVTVALGYARDIQNFAGLARDPEIENKWRKEGGNDDIVSQLRSLQTSIGTSHVGMRAADWVYLVKAASDCGDWKVCVNTLQFLRPHIQRTNPEKRQGGATSLLDVRYEQIAPALTAACLCLERKSQYAWGERVLNDWITWSGRKPRPEAVLSVIRNLSDSGQGGEVKDILAKCVGLPGTTKYAKKGVSYEEMLYIGAISSLHKSGMYDDADEVFISAISQGHLPFLFGRGELDNGHVLDLHGMNVAMAHSAVRIAMRRLTTEGSDVEQDLMIITGRGRNSALRMRPVLRPEVQRMLLEEFYPPLNTVSVPGNTGALIVYKEDISTWQTQQQEQKGVRMMELALLLKNVSTDRMHSIATKLGSTSEQT